MQTLLCLPCDNPQADAGLYPSLHTVIFATRQQHPDDAGVLRCQCRPFVAPARDKNPGFMSPIMGVQDLDQIGIGHIETPPQGEKLETQPHRLNNAI